jgi:hypothetical protein
MLGDIPGNPLHSLAVLEHVFQVDRLIQYPVQFFNIADAFRLSQGNHRRVSQYLISMAFTRRRQDSSRQVKMK